MSRFKYSYNALVYYGEDIARSIDRVARFGYDAIEVVVPAIDLTRPRVCAESDESVLNWTA